MNNLTNSKGEILQRGKLIAKGGEGEVYTLLGSYSSYCVKIYHKSLRDDYRKSKLEYLCNNSIKILETERFKICWPKDTVFQHGLFVGFIMPIAFSGSTSPYSLCLPEFPKNIDSSWRKLYDRNSKKGILSRLMLSYNIVAGINLIHSAKKYVLVDLKPQNLLITLDGKVSIIDVDSIQVVENNNVLFKAPVTTPEYTPPEAKRLIRNGNLITSDWDMFSVGVIIYEILFGIHPYVATLRPPNDNLTTIGSKIEGNMSHVIATPSHFEVLPILHKPFYSYSKMFQSFYKRLFASTSNRPNLEEFGLIIGKEIENVNKNGFTQSRPIPKVKNYTNNIKKTTRNKLTPKHVSSPPKENIASYNSVRPRRPKSWLVESIIQLVFCSPFAIAGVVNANRVESKYMAGDYAGAEEASKNAKKWNIISLWVIGGIFALYLFILFMAVINS